LLLSFFNFAGIVCLISALVLGGLLLYAAWTRYRWSSMYLAFINHTWNPTCIQAGIDVALAVSIMQYIPDIILFAK